MVKRYIHTHASWTLAVRMRAARLCAGDAVALDVGNGTTDPRKLAGHHGRRLQRGVRPTSTAPSLLRLRLFPNTAIRTANPVRLLSVRNFAGLPSPSRL